MRLSQHFGRTLREAPADASLTSHSLAVRAGLARPLAEGIWSYLPLGYRAIRRLEGIIRDEMEKIEAQEMKMPVLHPAEVWQATGRWQSFGRALLRLKNREGREFALGATHEEIVVHLCLREIESYKDLPRLVYQFQTKERDEPRARGGLIRLREFLMKDAYSLHADAEDLNRTYEKCYQAYLRIFERCGLDVVPVEADSGLMGGGFSHEFMLPHPQGEDRYMRCADCDYAANIEAARFERREALYGDPLPIEKVATPDCKTIADLCAFLNIRPDQTLKVVFYSLHDGQPDEQVVMVLLRGDLGVSEAKLLRLLGVDEIVPAWEEQITRIGGSAGYASPVGMAVQGKGGPAEGVLVIADESLQSMSNFVTGANEDGFHLINANYPRDFAVTQFADIAEPYQGAPCPRCGGELRVERAIELGHCFKLGTRYSEPVGATYLDAGSREQLIVMGSYGIGLDRLLAAVIEAHHDDHGIVWPQEIAPYDVHLVALAKDEDTARAAEDLYRRLVDAGVRALYDDRNLSPGVMFADADLMGLPLRVTVGKRSLDQGGVEARWRHESDSRIIPLDGAVEQIAEMLNPA